MSLSGKSSKEIIHKFTTVIACQRDVKCDINSMLGPLHPPTKHKGPPCLAFFPPSYIHIIPAHRHIKAGKDSLGTFSESFIRPPR